MSGVGVPQSGRKMFLVDVHIQVTERRLEPRCIWVQGYIVGMDATHIEFDDGTAVSRMDIRAVRSSGTDVDSVLQVGRYVSCVCTVTVLQNATCHLRVDSVCDLSRPEDALAEPCWWLEVAAARKSVPRAGVK